MCGRIARGNEPLYYIEHVDPEALILNDEVSGLTPRLNIGPTQPLLAYCGPKGTRVWTAMRWGLIPKWVKDPAAAPLLFNARSETAATKNSFRNALKRRRCLIPVDGYFEWHKKEGLAKQPYFIHRTDGRPLVLAGVWEKWKGVDNPLVSCAVLTTSPNKDLQPLHPRMPVVVEEGEWEIWMDGNPETDIPHLLRPADRGTLRFYPVTRSMGNVRYSSPGLLDPVKVSGRRLE